MIKLKPCPFCGGKAEIRRDSETETFFVVICTNCPATVSRSWFSKKQEAINAWNMRTSEGTACSAWQSCWSDLKNRRANDEQ